MALKRPSKQLIAAYGTLLCALWIGWGVLCAEYASYEKTSYACHDATLGPTSNVTCDASGCSQHTSYTLDCVTTQGMTFHQGGEYAGGQSQTATYVFQSLINQTVSCYVVAGNIAYSNPFTGAVFVFLAWLVPYTALVLGALAALWHKTAANGEIIPETGMPSSSEASSADTPMVVAQPEAHPSSPNAAEPLQKDPGG
jgi:hypothetical protein